MVEVQIDGVAAAVALLAGGWSALAVTQPIYANVNKITLDLIQTYEDAVQSKEKPSSTQISKILALRKDYWFLSASLFVYFIFIGCVVYFALDLISQGSSSHAYFIRNLGIGFLAVMLLAGLFYVFFEIQTVLHLRKRNILRWGVGDFVLK